jgi:hypothetical protein
MQRGSNNSKSNDKNVYPIHVFKDHGNLQMVAAAELVSVLPPLDCPRHVAVGNTASIYRVLHGQVELKRQRLMRACISSVGTIVFQTSRSSTSSASAVRLTGAVDTHWCSTAHPSQIKTCITTFDGEATNLECLCPSSAESPLSRNASSRSG